MHDIYKLREISSAAFFNISHLNLDHHFQNNVGMLIK